MQHEREDQKIHEEIAEQMRQIRRLIRKVEKDAKNGCVTSSTLVLLAELLTCSSVANLSAAELVKSYVPV